VSKLQVLVTLKSDPQDEGSAQLKLHVKTGQEDTEACYLALGDAEVEIEKIQLVEE
jgi:hypothetical protein